MGIRKRHRCGLSTHSSVNVVNLKGRMPQEKRQERKLSARLLIIGTLLGTILTSLLIRIFRYFRRLLRQPRMAPKPAQTLPEKVEDLEKSAWLIASQNLTAGIEQRLLNNGQKKLILNAGLRNFREPWARDFGFASFGLVALGKHQATREGLEVFLQNQTLAGQLPIKIHGTNVLDRYLHSLLGRQQPSDRPIKPKYRTAHNTISLDGNALLVIAALNYIEAANDRDFAATYWVHLKKALLWLEEYVYERDGLLHQGAFADWADSIARQGRVLYTNVIYWKALTYLASAASELGYIDDREYFERKSQLIKESINDHFWREDLGYYVTNEVFDNLSSSGNLLGIAWGLTNDEQAESILDSMNDFGMADPVPTKPVQFAYPKRFIAIENRLGGLGNYHTDAAWLWLGCWHVIALQHVGRRIEGLELLHRIARVIIRDGEVHEVYAPTGDFISTFWYTSEAPLTWSAGMYVYAHSILTRTEAEEPHLVGEK